jgi:hypothetical protein
MGICYMLSCPSVRFVNKFQSRPLSDRPMPVCRKTLFFLNVHITSKNITSIFFILFKNNTILHIRDPILLDMMNGTNKKSRFNNHTNRNETVSFTGVIIKEDDEFNTHTHTHTHVLYLVRFFITASFLFSSSSSSSSPLRPHHHYSHH